MRTALRFPFLVALLGLSLAGRAQCVTSLVTPVSCTVPGGATIIADGGGANNNVSIVGGTYRYVGTNGINNLNMAGGTLYFDSNGNLNNANISGGTIIFLGTGSATGITQSGGTLQVCGQRSITGNLNGGSFVVTDGGQLTFPNTFTLQNSARLTNYGTVVFQGNLTIASGTTGSFVNAGTLTAGGQVFLNGPGFVNQRTASFGTLTINGSGRACLSPGSTLNVSTFQTNDNANSLTVSPTTASNNLACVRVGAYGNFNALLATAVPSKLGICRAGTISNAELARYGTAQVTQNCTSCSTVLPVELVEFTARRSGPAQVQLRWRTAQELRNRGFAVETSSDGKQWQQVAFVAGAGTTSGARSYALTVAAAGAGYYRLAQYDEGATEPTVSPAQFVVAGGAGLAVYPNPARRTARLASPAAQGGELLSAQGTLVRRYSAGTQELDLQGVPAGLYLLRCGRETVRLVVE